MFSKVLEEKNTYKNSEGVLLKDLTESIFINVNSIGDELCSYYRVSKDMEMRPDKISTSLYGENKYTEIILKYSNIDNPFSLEEGDFIIAPSFSNVYYNVKDLDDHEKDDSVYTAGNANGRDDDSNYKLIENYHKYIDKSKIPSQIGSDQNMVDVPSSASQNTSSENFNLSDSTNGYIEPNMANKGKSGIQIINGKIYFGPTVTSSTDNMIDVNGSNDTSSNIVDCAKNGVTLGQFLNAAIKNNI